VKKISLFLMLFMVLNADIIKHSPLFAVVKNIKENDVLNVRATPDYRSKKIGYLPNEAMIKVYKCKKIKNKSTWCKIGHMGLYDYEGYEYGALDGWVNAKFLNFYNSGYVLVNKKGNCYYSFGCKEGICDVLLEEEIKKIKRKYLLGVSRFEAFTLEDEEEGGEDPCNPNTFYIRIPKNVNTNLEIFIEYIQGWIIYNSLSYITNYIHPKKGLYLTYYTTFARKNNHFTQKKFLNYLKSNKKLYWGKSDGKGDKIYMSLNEFFKYFNERIESFDMGQTLKINPNKFDFPNITKDTIAYEITQKQNGNNWQNLVIVLEKYKNRYYIVGLLYNRWSI